MIVTTSVAAYQCEPAIGAAYMAAKAGAAHLMRCVAQELAADGITVNAIAPGFFVTNIGGGHAKQPTGASGHEQHDTHCTVLAFLRISRAWRCSWRLPRQPM